MLEYLFNFITNNIVIIFLCVLSLAIASIYSKRIKCLFYTILCGAALYFVLLCLYRLGIGIEVLYEWSCKWVVMVCHQIDYISLFFFQQPFILTRVLKLFLHDSLFNVLLCLVGISFVLVFVLITIETVLPKFSLNKHKKVEINLKELNKSNQFTNTINRIESKYILNSVFRC